ncbi:MAG: hypothetical protein AB4372_17040 [Xenococcus sp. (in: cyanobacteria)]
MNNPTIEIDEVRGSPVVVRRGLSDLGEILKEIKSDQKEIFREISEIKKDTKSDQKAISDEISNLKVGQARLDEKFNNLTKDHNEFKESTRKNFDDLKELIDKNNSDLRELIDKNNSDLRELIDKNNNDLRELIANNNNNLRESIDKNNNDLTESIKELRNTQKTLAADVADLKGAKSLIVPIVVAVTTAILTLVARTIPLG